MRWLITGSKGQLGTDLVRHLSAAATEGTDEVVAVGRDELDVTDSVAVDACVARARPDVVINAAAYTAVDAAEADEETAHRVNAVAPALVAGAVSRHGGRLIHVSTDYVFPGTATEPYAVDAQTGPASAYGRTKLAGEIAVRELLPEAGFVVRTAWVYGGTGANFVKTMAKLESERDTVSVVDDQRGSPTWSADLATGLVELGRSAAAPGTYHATNAGDTTWCGFARAIFAELGADPARVLATNSAAFVRPAPRPAYSVLSPDAWIAAGLTPLPGWKDALHAAFESYGAILRPVLKL